MTEQEVQLLETLLEAGKVEELEGLSGPRKREVQKLHELAVSKPARVVAALRRLGWHERPTRSGKNTHRVMKKDGNPALITIPIHRGHDVKPGLLRHQLKDAGVPLDKFLAALR